MGHQATHTLQVTRRMGFIIRKEDMPQISQLGKLTQKYQSKLLHMREERGSSMSSDLEEK